MATRMGQVAYTVYTRERTSPPKLFEIIVEVDPLWIGKREHIRLQCLLGEGLEGGEGFIYQRDDGTSSLSITSTMRKALEITNGRTDGRAELTHRRKRPQRGHSPKLAQPKGHHESGGGHVRRGTHVKKIAVRCSRTSSEVKHRSSGHAKWHTVGQNVNDEHEVRTCWYTCFVTSAPKLRE